MRYFSVPLGYFRVISVLVVGMVFWGIYMHQTISSSPIAADRKPSQIIYDWYDRTAKAGGLDSLLPVNSSLHDVAISVIDSIFERGNHTLDTLDCPRLDEPAYHSLKLPAKTGQSEHIEYFFAIDLHQCVEVLPTLLRAVVEAIRFLGPERCALSVVEGRSDDGTRETLKLMKVEVESIGAKYYLQRNDIDPLIEGGNRIAALAQLRNDAVRPLIEHSDEYAKSAVVVFLNDVFLCTEDILELVLQQRQQQAHMVCAMDWTYVGIDPTFYDVWIARGMTGDTFFNVPPDGNWNSAWNLFWNDDTARSSLHAGRPFQVFACWNGATVITAEPFLSNKIRFRHSYPEECMQGEPQLFCKDLWYLNYHKIAVVPSVNLEYNIEGARKIKAAKGFVSTTRQRNNNEQNVFAIDWNEKPPESTKCAPTWDTQHWIPWDESLADHVHSPG